MVADTRLQGDLADLAAVLAKILVQVQALLVQLAKVMLGGIHQVLLLMVVLAVAVLVPWEVMVEQVKPLVTVVLA
jgi:hypothetical protein